MDYLKTPARNSFYIFPVTENEIVTEINKLKPGKATGPYSVPVPILKILKFIVAKPLKTIFNASISMGIVPAKLKLSHVIPIYKKGLHTIVSNYRPISLLSIFHKLLEKLISNRLLDYLEKNNILFENQFGFRTKHSTDYAILSIVDKIQRAIDEKYLSCGIFLDYSKAFDTVNHNILIEKLEYYGIRGIAKNWFISYLNNRQQIVTINNSLSDIENISCGIPQGSVLGPILFLLYINDFYLCSEMFQFHLFADDANLFYKHKDLNSLETNVNNELQKVQNWLCANKLSLNVDKSNFVIFHPPQKKMKSNVQICINDKPLKHEQCIKYLGILIDSNLSWKPQIENIIKKVRRGVGIICKIRYFVDISILKTLYYAIIHPFLTYGILAWGNTYRTSIEPLFILQKKALRLMTFSKIDQHSSPLFKSLEIVKIYDLVVLNIALFMYKFHNRILPSCFSSLFTQLNTIHYHNTRLAKKESYYLPKVRTNYGIFNIRYQGPKTWNSLPEDLKSLKLNYFKDMVKKSFINEY